MKYHLIAVGTRMPSWVTTGMNEYSKRLPKETPLILHEVAAAKRSKTVTVEQCKQRESDAICQRLNPQAYMVLLDVAGKPWSTEDLAQQIQTWQHAGEDIHFVIGGADGVSQACQQRADRRWSLSPLTLPHPLVRIILAEQLYRAVSILQQHPYHRR